MRKKRTGNTEVYKYLKDIEPHFDYLVKAGKMKEPTRDCFFAQFISSNRLTYQHWWIHGIKKIYIEVLFLLDEIKKRQEKIKNLEQQLKDKK